MASRMQSTPVKDARDRIARMQADLASIIDRHTEGVADCATAVPNLTLFRREAPARPAVCMIEPSIVMVAQGTKRLLVGGEGYAYDAQRFLLTSLDLPANSEVIEASAAKPCVGFGLKLDIRLLAELIAQDSEAPRPARSPHASVGVGSITVALLEPFVRQIASVGSQSHRVARAIDWLKIHYAQPLRIEELAARVQMSPSSLHHHFRQLTAMSPLQYQKWLRLNEARRLMLSDGVDAATAAFGVGYESPSQFSREYARLFGAPPRRDVEALRQPPAGLLQRPTSTTSAAG